MPEVILLENDMTHG